MRTRGEGLPHLSVVCRGKARHTGDGRATLSPEVAGPAPPRSSTHSPRVGPGGVLARLQDTVGNQQGAADGASGGVDQRRAVVLVRDLGRGPGQHHVEGVTVDGHAVVTRCHQS